MYSLRRTEELDEVRELHTLAMPEDAWVGDDHTFWIARDESKKPVGFCSAIYRPESGYVFLSRAAVAKSAQGHGLQRRMIRARVAWARKQGATEVITYTLLKNYESFLNLLKCGFRFYKPENPWVGTSVHYLRIKF
jgi:GNAT superfamily N-acetyltransferase